jgi:GTPase KRas protein
MQDQWFRTGQGFLCVYSIISRKSFNEIPALRDKILRIKDAKSVPMVLVGNKCDLQDEVEVPRSEGEEMAKRFGCPFFESSAKNHINVDESFRELVREVRRFKTEAEKAHPSVKQEKKKKGCILI